MKLLFHLIAHIVGRLYLLVRYKKKAKDVRDKEYNGSYSACDTVLFLNLIAGTGALALTILLIALIVSIVYRLITGRPG